MSRLPNPGRCQFCEDPAPEAVCDWPVKKAFPVKAKFLKIGDILVHPRHGRRIQITQVTPIRRSIIVIAEGFLKTGKKAVTKQYRWVAWSQVLVLDDGRCEQPCCFRHRRHVAEDRDYCLAHWESWKAA